MTPCTGLSTYDPEASSWLGRSVPTSERTARSNANSGCAARLASDMYETTRRGLFRHDDADVSACRRQPGPSDGAFVPLAGPNPNRAFDMAHENLTVPDAFRLCRLFDGFENLVDQVLGNHDLELHFGDEVDDVR